MNHVHIRNENSLQKMRQRENDLQTGNGVQNCRDCGQVFEPEEENLILCPKCLQQANYAKVRQYVKTHPGSNLFDVVSATGLESSIVLKCIRSGIVSRIENY